MSSPASYFVQRAIAPGGAGSSPSLRGPSPVIRSMPNPGTSLAVHCSGGGTGTGPVGSEFHFEAPNLPFASAHGIRGDVPPAAVGPGEMVKKKRGRPRKYAPDGSAALALPPISSSAPPGMASGSGSASGQKRGRGRPPGTGRKQQLALFGEWVAGSAGTGFTPHVIRIAEGEDIASKLMSFAQQGPRAICIISANGAVSTVTLRQPAMPSGIATYEGRFEILCLSGSYLLSEDGGSHSRTGGLSISLSNHDGRVFGGGVGGLLIAATTVQASVCIKITALCPISLLEKMSDLLRWNEKDPSFDLPWKANSFPILSRSSPLYLTPSMPEPLTDAEEHELRLAHQRLTQLCKQCAEANLMLLVDAEYASVQPAIDYFTYLAALQFNREQPLVYGTLQAYLRDAKERLVKMVQAAEMEGMSIGIKLVRGAYLTRETQLASSLGVPSPIHRSIQETHSCYNDCASFLLEKVRQGSGAVVLATHNVKSGQIAAAKAEELGIAKDDQKLQFAQLKGMADGLSLGLNNAGFQVNKYLPFGPVDQVIPYLLRRAEENRGFLSTSATDRQLISKELMRRLKTAVLGRI